MNIHKIIREGRLRLKMTEEEFAAAVGVTRGSVQQWEREDEDGGTAPRRKTQPAVAKLLGITVSELMAQDDAHPPEPGVAHHLSVRAFTVPPKIDWEELKKMDHLPERFSVEMPDDSLAGRIDKGTVLVFLRGSDPPPAGHGVLVRDRDGNTMIRRYRPVRGAQWQAQAMSDAYETLDSIRDGLKIVAIMTGRMDGSI